MNPYNQARFYIAPTAQKEHLHCITNIYLAMQWNDVGLDHLYSPENISKVSETKHLSGGSGHTPDNYRERKECQYVQVAQDISKQRYTYL